MKPVLIYDGYCNMCVSFVKTLELYHKQSNTEHPIEMIPYQKAEDVINTYQLNRDELENAFHFITTDGHVFKAGAAIDQLANIYPILKLGSGFFTTQLGESVYSLIAQNRYSIFGCQDECYVPGGNGAKDV